MKQEFLALEKILTGKFFLNQKFTLNNLQKELNQNYSLLHIATHTYFGGSLENIFLYLL